MTKSLRVSAYVLGCLIMLPLLTSCGKDTATTDENQPVVIWHWMTDRDEAFHALAERYKTETGKIIQFQLYAPSDVYAQKVRVGAQTNSLPDVYGVLGDSRDLDLDVIYGRWPVKEALESGPVARIFLAKGTKGDNLEEIVDLAREKRVACDWVDRRRIDQLTGTDTHQGVAAQVAPFRFVELDEIWEAAQNSNSNGVRVLILDSIMDPQNLGSLLRSAVFFGVVGVVIPKWRAASVSSAVVRASAGAARLVPIAQVANLATAMEAGKKAGLWFVGADMDGVDAKTADVPRPLGLVMGSEGEGLHALVKKKCDIIVSIPRKKDGRGVESLNVGVAGGILLHQFS